MGMTAVTLAALLTSGMRMFFHRRTMDSQAQDQINRRRAELMDPQVILNTISWQGISRVSFEGCSGGSLNVQQHCASQELYWRA